MNYYNDEPEFDLGPNYLLYTPNNYEPGLNFFEPNNYMQDNEKILDLGDIHNSPKNEDFIIEEEKTKPTKYLGKKRTEEKINISENIDISEENLNFTKNEFNQNSKTKGRKRKDDTIKGAHNKFSEDNMMRKIKSFFLNSCFELINKSIKNKQMQLLKLNSEIGENLKKDYNLKLLDTTLKYLFFNSKISLKYRKKIKTYYNLNKKIIKKIFEENKEKEAIQLLNLTYRELFQIFRKKFEDIDLDLKTKIYDIEILKGNDFKDILNFIEEIKEKEINKNEEKQNIDVYLENIKNLCINYENWFLGKKGRNRKKDTNQKEELDNNIIY